MSPNRRRRPGSSSGERQRKDREGRRNPSWTRDEEILLLDLYLRYQPRSERDARVVELSETLRALPIHPRGFRTATFRNPTGVFMKLGNLRHIDPSYAGRGLGRTNRMAALVWAEFASDVRRLQAAAEAIRRSVIDRSLSTQLHTPEEGEEDAVEGRILFRLHRIRERHPRLVQAKKRRVVSATGRLACEVCGFDFADRYGEAGRGIIECHHTTPLARLKPGVRTRLADLALVCANCHRVLHRGKHAPTIEQLRALLHPTNRSSEA